jgi:tetratricopeptide (TPR) repeat protein
MAFSGGDHGAGVTVANTQLHSGSRLAHTGLLSLAGFLYAGFAALWLASQSGIAADAGVSSPAVAGQTEDDRWGQTNYQQLLNAILQLEDRLRSNQLAFELDNLELRRQMIQNTEALSNGLMKVQVALSDQEGAFSVQSAREMEVIQSSNKALLVVGGSFAAITALAMLLVAFFQWRMSRVWTVISASSAFAPRLGGAASAPALGLPGTAAVEQSSARLLGAMEQLEKRVYELEASSSLSVEPHTRAVAPADNGDSPAAGNGGNPAGPGTVAGNPDPRVRMLLSQGQALLKESKLEAALTCFDQALTLDPNHTEALVKKGSALERMHKVNEAFACYDRAIDADSSMTMAYLYKGGLCSRLERFREALECYEQALRTHDERHG